MVSYKVTLLLQNTRAQQDTSPNDFKYLYKQNMNMNMNNRY